MRIAYKEANFRPDRLDMIHKANAILKALAGYTLTVRQLYYQFVSRDWIENTPKSYDRIVDMVNEARLAGMLSWTAIEDRTRNLERLASWDDPGDAMRAISSQYRLDMWENQDNYVEVWIEKEALAGIFEPICEEMRVPFFCCRGYTSQSEMWRAGIRLKDKAENGKTPVILHFGDHDPSGIDMTRDIEERLSLFMEGEVITVDRLALNMDQVRRYNPPPNPAKLTDSRAHGPEGYIRKYGRSSWELDALNPPVLHALVRDAVYELIDDDTWQTDKEREAKYKTILEDASGRWEDVAGFLGHDVSENDDE